MGVRSAVVITSLAALAFTAVAAVAGPLTSSAVDAAKAGDLAALQRALDGGVDRDARDATGATLLMWACYRGDLPMVLLLVEAGADPLARGVLPLNPKVSAYYGGALVAAAGEGHLETVAYLVEHAGVPVDDGQIDLTGRPVPCSALIEAASGGHEDVVEYLLAAHADVNLEDEHGRTPLLAALDAVHPTVAAMLLRSGANVRSTLPDTHMTPLHLACRPELASLVPTLIEAGGEPEAAATGGYQPIHACAWYCAPGGLQALIAAGADVDAATEDGTTPLHVAARSGCAEAVEVLLTGGADPRAEAEGWLTPADLARDAGHGDLGDILAAAAREAERREPRGEGDLLDLFDRLDSEVDRTSDEFLAFRAEVDPDGTMSDDELEGMYRLRELIGGRDDRTESAFLSEVGLAAYPAAEPPGDGSHLLRWDFSREYQYVYRTEVEAEGGFLSAMMDESDGLFVIRAKGDHTAEFVNLPFTRDSDADSDQGSGLGDLFSSVTQQVLQGMTEDSKIPGAEASQGLYLQMLFPLATEALEVGQSSRIETRMPFNAMGSLLWVRGAMTVTLSGFVAVEGHRCARLDVDVDLSDIDVPDEVPMAAECSVTGRGVFYFNLDEGCFQEGELATLMSMRAGLAMQLDSVTRYHRDRSRELELNAPGDTSGEPSEDR